MFQVGGCVPVVAGDPGLYWMLLLVSRIENHWGTNKFGCQYLFPVGILIVGAEDGAAIAQSYKGTPKFCHVNVLSVVNPPIAVFQVGTTDPLVPLPVESVEVAVPVSAAMAYVVTAEVVKYATLGAGVK